MTRPALPATNDERLPSLDGLRGVAIGLVVISHGWTQLNVPAPGWWQTIVQAWGYLGVELFFGLSGYLITHLLCRELRMTGRLQLKAFYLRRALRILPPLVLFLGTLALLNLVGVFAVPWGQMLAGLFFVKNYFIGDALTDYWFVAHLWSLSLEEQFYLLLPFGLALLGPKRAAKVAIILIVIMPAVRVASYFIFPSHAARSIIAGGIHSAVDHFLWGSLLALYRDGGRHFFPRQMLRSSLAFYAIASLFLFLIPFLEKSGGAPYAFILGISLRAACAIFIIVWLEQNLTSVAARLVNTRGLRALGLISYGVYLWQQLFLGERNQSFVGLFPLAVLGSLGAATISYHLVEAPLLNLRRRFRPRAPVGVAVAA